MFTTVKDLTALLERDFSYVEDAIKIREEVSDEDFRKYCDYMTSKIIARVEKLKSISCSKKMIDKYSNLAEKRINDLKNAM